MLLISPGDWRPRGVDDLEPNAWRALRQAGSSCVVAGPGAGKTEFLAQRAVFLLETGLCPSPYRILAISFKGDAASNLMARVRKRCPAELANRFTSLTFDAFTKGLVDRFHPALPRDWRPTKPYGIVSPTKREIREFFDNCRTNAPTQWQGEIEGLPRNTFESHYVGTYQLPVRRSAPQSGTEFAFQQWWDGQLRAESGSAITFVSINRLAELLLRATPHIRHALRLTYPFVFIDEFQDTTFAQYDFLLSAFGGGGIAVTAVCDEKQRIMIWAGARPDAFKRFNADFDASCIALNFNFRSSPDLVRIQHVVAQVLDPQVECAVSRTEREIDGDVAQVWNSSTVGAEAIYLANWLSNDMAARNRSPRDYAILVRQKSDDYEAELAGPFAEKGLRMRNESHKLGRTTLQDLLSEDFTKIAIALLRLGATSRAPEAWSLCCTALIAIRGDDPQDEIAAANTENELATFATKLRRDMAQNAPSAENASALAARIFTFLDLSAVARSYVQYASGDLLEIMTEAFRDHLIASTNDSMTWTDCLDAFEGVGQIPLMTVHKSKGLEYDTIIFVGLDDTAWWAHKPGDLEGLATFFVALSRAKQRAIFAFCQERGRRQLVSELFQLLRTAGVPELSIMST